MFDPVSMTPAAATAVATQAHMGAVSTPGPGLQVLSDQFNKLMAKEPDPQVYSEQHLSNEQSPASAFVSSQEKILHSTFDEVRSFSIDAPNMTMQDMAARHIDLSYQISMVSVQYNAGVYLAQSSKSALTTLMKNQ